MFTTYDLQQFLNSIATLFQWAYWGTMLLMLVILVPIAFRKGKSHNRQIWNAIGASVGIVLLFVQIIPMLLMMAFAPSKAERQAAEEWQRKYQAAEALFKQQCEKAGEKIYRTVENVEGIMLLKIVSEEESFKDSDAYDPMWANAAFLSSGGGGDGFVKIFLGHYGNGTGYSYIDVLAENQKDIIRYTGKRPLLKEKNPKNPARYAITFEQNIDPELRKHWVAGGTIQVIDRQTNEIIAEKTSYVFEKGLGGRGGGRMPWMFAEDCPNQPFVRPYPIFKFLISVVKPKQETQNVK